MTRRNRLYDIEKSLGKRKLIWLGSRGTDGESLLDLPQFSAAFSVISPMGSLAPEFDTCLELIKKKRHNLDVYTPDSDQSEEMIDYCDRLADFIKEPCVVIAYRPWSFFTTIYLSRIGSVQYLGLLPQQQSSFEYKPWIDLELRRWGVQTIPWQYFLPHEVENISHMLGNGPLVLRPVRSVGGTGIQLVNDKSILLRYLGEYQEPLVCVSPYLYPSISLNISACVFEGGDVSIHSPSIQLIGLPGVTSKIFGYCGNDFAQISELDDRLLDQLEDVTIKVGKWLSSRGYIGSFGLDVVVYDGKIYVTEVNPRFQGSSHLSATIDLELDRADVFLEHMAAFLGMIPPRFVRVRDIARNQRKVSQLICHNCEASTVFVNNNKPPDLSTVQLSLIPSSDVEIDPDAILFRATIEGSVTKDGRQLIDQYNRRLQNLAQEIVKHESLG